jgi:hypothetical protein
MKKILFSALVLLMAASLAYGESEFYNQWFDHWNSEGLEAGKKDDKYDPDASYAVCRDSTIMAKYKELKDQSEQAKAEEFLQAATKGFYAGYRSGYYRDKEGEIIESLETKFQGIQINNFKFGAMDPGDDFVVRQETGSVKVPSVEGEMNYFGYTFDYTGNYLSDKLIAVLSLPARPEKDLGPKYFESSNSIIAEHQISYEGGFFGDKWVFTKGDVTGKFRLALYIGGKLVKTFWFEAVPE